LVQQQLPHIPLTIAALQDYELVGIEAAEEATWGIFSPIGTVV